MKIVANDINNLNYQDILNGISKGASMRIAIDAERELGMRDTWYLGRHILGYDWLDSQFHRALCTFIDMYWLDCQLHLHPRGHLKTTTMVVKNIRRVLRNPDWREFICSNKIENSAKMLSGIRSHFVHNDKFRSLYPEHATETKGSEGTAEKFTTPARVKKWIQESTFEAGSISATVVSRHYDGATFDDICDGMNSRTNSLREEVKRVYKETLSVLTPRKNINPIITVVGTRWHYDDIYNWLLSTNKRGKFKVFITQAYQLDSEGNKILLFPEQVTEEYLNDLKESQQDYIFSCQYMNNPIPEESKDLDPSRFLNYEDCEKPFEGPVNRYITVDPGGWIQERGIVRSDDTFILVSEIDSNGHIWLRDGRFGNFNPDDQISQITELAMRYSPRTIGIETVAFQKVLSFYLKKRFAEDAIHIRITEIRRSRTSKEERIKRIIPFLNAGMIHIPVKNGKYHSWVKRLLVESDEFPSGKHDDALDTLSDLIEIMNKPYIVTFRDKDFRMPTHVHKNSRHFQTGYSIRCK